MSEDIKALLTRILDTQEKCQSMLIDLQLQTTALTNVLVSLDPRAALLLSTQIETLTERHRALLEKALKDAALLRATVSKMVQ